MVTLKEKEVDGLLKALVKVGIGVRHANVLLVLWRELGWRGAILKGGDTSQSPTVSISTVFMMRRRCLMVWRFLRKKRGWIVACFHVRQAGGRGGGFMGWVIRIIFDPNTRQWGGGGFQGW